MIIDANVFKGFYQAELGTMHMLCGCPSSLFNKATAANPIFHDSGGIIESEWVAVVDREWFEPWLANQLIAGLIAYTEQKKDAGLERNLVNLGFPGGRDFVYIRTGLGIISTNKSHCRFFTEDLDFYDPTKKGCPAKTRNSILRSSAGPVAKLLKKRKILVECVP